MHGPFTTARRIGRGKTALVAAMCVLWGSGSWAGGGRQAETPPPDAIATALYAMYNVDFTAAQRTLDAHLKVDPSDPLGYAARAAALLFQEYQRLKILEIDFFEDDDALTDKERLTPDPAVRERIFAATAEARGRAKTRLGRDAKDRRALFATVMAASVETQYTTIVEKSYGRGGSLAKEVQTLADRLVKLDPPVYDAYLSMSSIEYGVSRLNPVYRLFARLRGLRSSKDHAVEQLRLVAARGQYDRPYAKILLAVIHIREQQLPLARVLLDELRKEFPANPIFPRELARIEQRIGPAK